MTTSPSRREVVFAALAGLTGVAGSYAVTGYSREFLVAPIDDAVVRATPGPIVAWMIQNVGERAHLLHIALSFAIAVGLLAVAAVVGLRVARRLDRPAVGVGLAGVAAWGLTASITAEPLLAIGAGVPVLAFAALGATPVAAPEHDPSRRRALVSGVSALAFLATALGFRRLTADDDTAGGEPLEEIEGGNESETTDDGDDEATLMEQAEANALDIEGDVPGLVSTFDEFYNVDIADSTPNSRPTTGR
ncbi:hypothetical protein SAMN05444422_102375 [Halobiforma haloterrestris]|uniref:Uncharacterized protein n=1 Tax=Natronobacterium haloterrestre TaxID=148448 RepID=A0A1I1EDN5_NATHA|nr:hypothetical protein [Halobiforma haloterrestris]SFB84886.1 hypothetical protein SAMN05444422_102375 [Halobiforma haloterrestris]